MLERCPQCGSGCFEESAHEAIGTLWKDPQRVCKVCGTLVDLNVGLHIGRGDLDEILSRKPRFNSDLEETQTEVVISDEVDREFFDCSDMERCQLIFDNCPNLGKIRSIGASVYDDPNSEGYAKVTLNYIPIRDIEMEGKIHTIEISSGYDRLSSGIGGGPSEAEAALSTEGSARNARVCINLPEADEIEDVEHLVVVFQGSQSSSEVTIGEGADLRYLGMMGGLDGIRKVTVNCESGASRISIEGMRSLECVELLGSTQVLDIRRCPRLRSVSGSGNTLSISGGEGPETGYIRLSGFWIKAPKNVVPDRGGLSLEEISTCSDLGHACFSHLDYIAGCEIEEAIGRPMAPVTDALPLSSVHIPSLVEGLSRNAGLVPRLIEWFPSLPLLQDQYYMMRVLVSLSHSGASQDHISQVRTHVLNEHSKLSYSPHLEDRFVTPRMIESGASAIYPVYDDDSISGSMASLHSRSSHRNDGALESYEESPWKRPLNSFIPIERVDLELWVMLGVSNGVRGPSIPVPTSRSRASDRSTRIRNVRAFSSWIKQILPTLLRETKEDESRAMIEEFTDDVFDVARGPFLVSMHNEAASLYDVISYHLTNPDFSESLHKDRFEERFIEHLGETKSVPLWIKAAVSYGMIQNATTMSLKWKFLIKRLIKELPIKEAARLRAPSISGARAFSDGHVQSLEWPFVENWRLQNERK